MATRRQLTKAPWAPAEGLREDLEAAGIHISDVIELSNAPEILEILTFVVTTPAAVAQLVMTWRQTRAPEERVVLRAGAREVELPASGVDESAHQMIREFLASNEQGQRSGSGTPSAGRPADLVRSQLGGPNLRRLMTNHLDNDVSIRNLQAL